MSKTLLGMLLAALGGGLVALILCVSIAPVSDWTQEAAACWGADRVERDVRPGPTVQARRDAAGGGYVSTTTFTLSCRFGHAVRHVENDEAVVKGFALSFLLGALPSAALVLFGRLRARRTP